MPQRPSGPVGLYDPSYEHDACGVAMVAKLDGKPSHETVERAIVALENLEHRGAAGADPNTGDGAGILLQMPDEFIRGVIDAELPPQGAYGVCVCFLPREEERRQQLEQLLEDTVRAEGQRVVGWRDVPVDKDYVGITANLYAPYIKHLVVAASDELSGDQDAFERKLYVIRRVAEIAAGPELVVPSFSSRTIVYKGMLTSPQVLGYFPDLADPRTKSALALVHSRFSTNTFPSWELAHPYRMIAHNGEINTLRGNVNWMRARESQLASELFGDDLQKVLPVVRPGGSDSATFDNVLELLVLAGRSLPHAVMMMIPEAYQDRDDLPDDLLGFYAFHSCLMEPWDGPAAVAFTDGRVIGATLDRNGLRPGRWLETEDGWVVLGSEAGVMDEPAANVKRKGRLQPGKLFLVDLERGLIVDDGDVKREVAGAKPYKQWFDEGIVHLADLPPAPPLPKPEEPLHERQRAFGFTQEDLRVLLAPTAAKAEEPIGSMGNDAALAVLSDREPPLFNYFKQLFAQVTNPPIDPIREAIVMSYGTGVGSERNLLDETSEHAHQLAMQTPILFDRELQQLRHVDSSVFAAHTVDITWPIAEGPEGMVAALERACKEADEALVRGVNILILSDRAVSPERAPIPALLAVAGVHHHLVREGTRLQTGLVLESGEPREVHHFATLIGYGATAINPYLMFESLETLVAEGRVPGVTDFETAQWNVVKGIAKGLLKTISKMGISTIQSYNGAQIFEAVGLAPDLISQYFVGTASRIGGIDADMLARETLTATRAGSACIRATTCCRSAASTPGAARASTTCGTRRRSRSCSTPSATAAADLRRVLEARQRGRGAPRHAARAVEVPRAARGSVARHRRRRAGVRDRQALRDRRDVARLDQSRETHETLAIAMNRLGGKSNTGEGGEDPVRFTPDPNGDRRRSAIKQVASGRFGVNINYLVNADELQIKMAQGAKPGEGGQLPGHKVDRYIGSIRFTTPGVGLISPPPHHDIYSIEDLKQLIYDLRCANPGARISVKLVSEVGVGTVAAGVAKANADHVLIAGHDGGTGASPLSSIQARGHPVGDRARRDAADAGAQRPALADLGADRRPAQDRPRRRRRRAARRRRVRLLDRSADRDGLHHDARLPPEHLPGGHRDAGPGAAQALQGPAGARRELLLLRRRGSARADAPAGHLRSYEDLVGRVDLLEADARDRALEGPRRGPHPRARRAARHRRRAAPAPAPAGLAAARRAGLDADRGGQGRDRPPDADHRHLRRAQRQPHGRRPALLRRHQGARRGGLPPGTIRYTLHGSAGQSFGAWLAPGVELSLFGDANDYTGKGLSRWRPVGPPA